ncbi:methionyl-tRNA ligase [Candidatus Mycoplasma haematolamae str. Purdue]|uniref:methionine--tRNA ligase n=1 Tax=Mycoplasma haematolamae (strain Purdue) TaxID=1212765 RepID=I7BKN0_MYCHA|nr:methionine--tRNA ligase [Candidatus Mycoplasma haematolamae]AFO52438.1 methionyl-tRNA ligase [Candidatus Mycoplasma haematolamae str. Purdue]
MFYASGDPHVGHAYTLIIADLIKRYFNLIGREAFLLTGTDEHGEKILNKALEEELSPQELVNRNSLKFQSLWKELELKGDYFIRTTDEGHKRFALGLFNSLLEKGKIYTSSWSGYKCISCETNYSEKYFNQSPVCELGHPLEKRSEDTYFLKVSEEIDWLSRHYESSEIVLPSHHLNSLKSGFFSSLEDLSITRKSLSWGIQLPNSDFAIYVWFEALSGYFSNPEVRKKWSPNSDTKIIQVIGKEIFRFHSIYLPVILKSLELKTPDKLLVHGWLLQNDRKISKSEMKTNPVLSLREILDVCNLESLKWYCLFLNWTDDHSFAEELIKQFYNKTVVNLFGNLINRLKGIMKKSDLVTGTLESDFSNKAFNEEWEKGTQLLEFLEADLDNLKIQEVVSKTIQLLEQANYLLEVSEPWKLSREDLIYRELSVFLYRQLVLSSYLLSPIFSSSRWLEIKEALSISNRPDTIDCEFLTNLIAFQGVKLPKTVNLFEKYDLSS